MGLMPCVVGKFTLAGTLPLAVDVVPVPVALAMALFSVAFSAANDSSRSFILLICVIMT